MNNLRIYKTNIFYLVKRASNSFLYVANFLSSSIFCSTVAGSEPRTSENKLEGMKKGRRLRFGSTTNELLFTGF